MILQLNPTIPIIRVSDKMNGYAFMIIDYSRTLFVICLCYE